MVSDAVPAPPRHRLLPNPLLHLASDQRLVEHARAGSERAFELLFDRHHRSVLSFCTHMLGSQHDAEDAVQQTFLSAYRELARSDQAIALRPWLYATARHRCLSMLRARRDHPVEEVSERAATYQLAADVDAREELRAILVDLARLPVDQRAALVLSQLGDLSHDEIARILDCPREKVRAVVFQARSALAAGRTARETPCADIRERLATLHGGSLRRTLLRRHLHDCPGCRAFRDEMRSQRRALGLLLPVAPTVGFKRAALGAVLGSGGGGSAVVTAGALGTGALAATALVAIAVPATGLTRDDSVGEPARPAVAATAAVRSSTPFAGDRRSVMWTRESHRAPGRDAFGRSGHARPTGELPMPAPSRAIRRPDALPLRRDEAGGDQPAVSATPPVSTGQAPATPLADRRGKPPAPRRTGHGGKPPAPARTGHGGKPLEPARPPAPHGRAHAHKPGRGRSDAAPSTPAGKPAVPQPPGEHGKPDVLPGPPREAEPKPASPPAEPHTSGIGNEGRGRDGERPEHATGQPL
jgi:RNA polymerase sigma factor (sigma-70 family)